MARTTLLPKSEVVNAARLTLALAALLGPYLLWKVPPGQTWAAMLVISGTLCVSLLLYVFSGRLTPSRNFRLVIGSMILLFSAVELTGGVLSRLTPLYFVLSIVTTELSGYAYGIGAAAVASALELLTLYLDSFRDPDPHYLETMYVHVTILAIAVFVGMYVWRRKQLLLNQATAAYELATALHTQDTPQRVLRVLATGVAASTAAEAAVLYKRSESADPDADPQVLASEGRWSKSLHESTSPGTIHHRLSVDGTTYYVALRRPKNYTQELWRVASFHFALALKRATTQVTTYAEMKRWFDLANTAQVDTLEALVAMLEARDPFTGGHSRRVAAYAARLAKHLGQTPDIVEEVRKAAVLHDIGKISLPDGILLKPGPLTPDEWREIRKHPTVGAELISKVSGLSSLAPLVRGHHERWDGQGYPDGLAGDEIPLSIRILAVADAFDAITTTRAYREAKSPAQACDILREGAGSQWCLTCVEAMIAMVSDSAFPTERLKSLTPQPNQLTAHSD